jgi:hypothetical protein
VVYRALGAEAGPRWAVYLNNGKLVSPGSAPEERAVAGTAFLPLQLIPRAGQTYLVVRDAEKGLGIQRVP